MTVCGATFELACGEHVTPCRLLPGHTGNHQGSCLDTDCNWPPDFGSARELAMAAHDPGWSDSASVLGLA